LAIDDIISRCGQTNDCVIPAGDIRVQYAQPIINRLKKLYTDTLGFSEVDQQGLNEYLQNAVDEFSKLLGSEVVFGETTYSILGGTPYDYRLETSLTQLDAEREFTMQWRDDKSVVELVSRSGEEIDASVLLSYFYQASSPGESVIAKVESIHRLCSSVSGNL